MMSITIRQDAKDGTILESKELLLGYNEHGYGQEKFLSPEGDWRTNTHRRENIRLRFQHTTSFYWSYELV